MTKAKAKATPARSVKRTSEVEVLIRAVRRQIATVNDLRTTIGNLVDEIAADRVFRQPVIDRTTPIDVQQRLARIDAHLTVRRSLKERSRAVCNELDRGRIE